MQSRINIPAVISYFLSLILVVLGILVLSFSLETVSGKKIAFPHSLDIPCTLFLWMIAVIFFSLGASMRIYEKEDEHEE